MPSIIQRRLTFCKFRIHQLFFQDQSNQCYTFHQNQIQCPLDKNQIEQKEVDTDSEQGAKPVKSRRGRQIVKPQVPAPSRFNLNGATPELLTQILPGVGLKTANEIIELRMSLPGERFSKLEQLRQIKHINWDEILSDAIYVE